MAMSTDEIAELRDTYNNLSAEELRGMRGDDEEQDALIDEILNKGKAVELEGGPLTPPEGEIETLDDEEEEEEEEGEQEAAAAALRVVEAAPVVEVPAPVVEATVDLPALDLSYLSEKYDGKLSALDEANAVSLQKLMSGEIEATDYAKAQAQYLRDRDTLKNEQAMEAQWGKMVHDFQATAAAQSGINYFTDAEKGESWDTWIKHFATKYPEKSGEWFLAEAHKKVMVEYGIAPAASPKAAETVADGKKVAPKTGRTPNLTNIPPTLSGLPAAAPAASGDGGEFDHLASLTGYKFEQAIARMSPDQRARYEAE